MLTAATPRCSWQVVAFLLLGILGSSLVDARHGDQLHERDLADDYEDDDDDDDAKSESARSDDRDHGAGDHRQAGSTNACPKGYHQRDPIALACKGGEGSRSVVLAPAGTAQKAFYWQAPRGTKDLRVTAGFRGTNSSVGQTGVALTVQCVDEPKVIIDAHRGILKTGHHKAHIDGADWLWSGDPTGKDKDPKTGVFMDGFMVTGRLGCNIEVVLSNVEMALVFGELKYHWDGVEPCPDVAPGCQKCPEDVCKKDEVAVCDGSAYWVCQSKHNDAGIVSLGHAAKGGASQSPAMALGHAAAGAAGDENKTAPAVAAGPPPAASFPSLPDALPAKEGGVPKPASPGCWTFMPPGCHGASGAGSWQQDLYGEAHLKKGKEEESCQMRKSFIEEYCGKKGVEMLYIPPAKVETQNKTKEGESEAKQEAGKETTEDKTKQIETTPGPATKEEEKKSTEKPKAETPKNASTAAPKEPEKKAPAAAPKKAVKNATATAPEKAQKTVTAAAPKQAEKNATAAPPKEEKKEEDEKEAKSKSALKEVPASAIAGKVGCCFRFGFGSRMKPCCLEVQTDYDETKCNANLGPTMLGGSGGYTKGHCPASASAAFELVQKLKDEAKSKGSEATPEPEEKTSAAPAETSKPMLLGATSGAPMLLGATSGATSGAPEVTTAEAGLQTTLAPLTQTLGAAGPGETTPPYEGGVQSTLPPDFTTLMVTGSAIRQPHIRGSIADLHHGAAATSGSPPSSPSWQSTMRAFLVGFGAILGAIGVGFCFVFVAMRKLSNDTQPLPSVAHRREAQSGNPAQFDRLPTSEDSALQREMNRGAPGAGPGAAGRGGPYTAHSSRPNSMGSNASAPSVDGSNRRGGYAQLDRGQEPDSVTPDRARALEKESLAIAERAEAELRAKHEAARRQEETKRLAAEQAARERAEKERQRKLEQDRLAAEKAELARKAQEEAVKRAEQERAAEERALQARRAREEATKKQAEAEQKAKEDAAKAAEELQAARQASREAETAAAASSAATAAVPTPDADETPKKVDEADNAPATSAVADSAASKEEPQKSSEADSAPAASKEAEAAAAPSDEAAKKSSEADKEPPAATSDEVPKKAAEEADKTPAASEDAAKKVSEADSAPAASTAADAAPAGDEASKGKADSAPAASTAADAAPAGDEASKKADTAPADEKPAAAAAADAADAEVAAATAAATPAAAEEEAAKAASSEATPEAAAEAKATPEAPAAAPAAAPAEGKAEGTPPPASDAKAGEEPAPSNRNDAASTSKDDDAAAAPAKDATVEAAAPAASASAEKKDESKEEEAEKKEESKEEKVEKKDRKDSKGKREDEGFDSSKMDDLLNEPLDPFS
eukprot:TRINITY_DN2312_c0_g1_i1.p1 TRINITY_DN2312_c0_g1~~TRINITY_DN2312_c0_g1_i1.p1  ORF type:complete len:1356 (-),score=470.49 TRINITY_DN2312_c0_g1_i1:65-4132(-)